MWLHITGFRFPASRNSEKRHTFVVFVNVCRFSLFLLAGNLKPVVCNPQTYFSTAGNHLLPPLAPTYANVTSERSPL
ncbi:hypothetical protein M8J75_005467 [Diaphorina citri]|nr:hypothetical protein M8J75_005467 [Diaphorina citri]